jgi:hypothetical protein
MESLCYSYIILKRALKQSFTVHKDIDCSKHGSNFVYGSELLRYFYFYELPIVIVI